MPLAPRETQSGTDEFLNLIANPFQTDIQATSIYAALVWSFAVSGVLFLLFCYLRPRSPTVYAPRAKHADEKHAPPSISRAPLAWFSPTTKISEPELVEKIGLDAVVFLRFVRMLRNIFLVLTVFGCGILIPVNVLGGHDVYEQYGNVATLMKFTPQYIFGGKFWAFVAVAYLFQATVCAFVWWNYRKVWKLRRAYFNSVDYRASLHSRTLLLTQIPKDSRTDTGIATLVESVKQTHSTPRTAIARNVQDLPKLISKHDHDVQKLEVILAQYLKTPNQLPSKRPLCKPSKKDRKHTGSGKVDAISYLTIRIAKLEISINELRESIDTGNPMPYGFASYTHIEDAHSIAYAARKKGPGCHISLAPKPHDLLWQNLPMIPAARRTRKFWDSIWMIVLTLIFIVPNVLTSVFLSDFSHLALFWSGFRTNLAAHPTGWGIVQGIAAPLVQTLLYLALPTIFRRLYTHSGDVSKTSRERHVTSRLYAFFVFNNLLVFSLFGCFSRFVAAVIAAQDIGVWTAIRNGHLFSNIMISLCNLSTFWLTWQMQRNLGAAIDLIQAWPLIYGSIRRKFFAPTPRELIALSAPQTFEYADYYNNFLFVATIGLCFGALQPLILPITAFYLALDGWFKTYLLQYVLITKTESGGAFWRMLVNRLLIGALLGNAVIALVVGAQGIGSIESVRNGGMLYAMIPLPFLLAAFKWHCKRAFDTRMQFYTTHSFAELEGADGEAALPSDEKKRKRADRVAVRFGHPALYKRLMTPMVHARSKHLIKELYTRHVENEDGFTTSRAGTGPGYSDVYMSEMDPAQPGAAALPTDITQATLPDVELVKEEDLDFENFKRRAEFREERGGDGELYGRPDDLISRPGTPSTTTTMTAVGATGGSGRSTRASSVTRLGDGGQDAPLGGGDEAGTVYGRGYQRPRAASVDVEIPDSKL